MSKGNNYFLGAYLWSTLIENKGWGPLSAKQRKPPPGEPGENALAALPGTGARRAAEGWRCPPCPSGMKRVLPDSNTPGWPASALLFGLGVSVAPTRLSLQFWMFRIFLLPWMNAGQHPTVPVTLTLQEAFSVIWQTLPTSSTLTPAPASPSL